MKTLEKRSIDTFSSDALNEQEMIAVLGGIRRKPKSRDKDILDLEDEE